MPVTFARCAHQPASNAVEYNRMAGRIDISVRSDDGANVIVDAGDTGVGMSAEQLDQLFQPFNRVGAEQTRVEVPALGLVIARGLAEAMGGALDVGSTLGQGTCFNLQAAPRRGRTRQCGWQARSPPPRSPVQARATGRGRCSASRDNTVNAPLMEAALVAIPSIALLHATHGASRPPAAGHALFDTDGHSACWTACATGRLRKCRPSPSRLDAMPDAVDRHALAQGFTAY